MIGGIGADVFVFDPSRENEGDDFIFDFELGVDRIELSAADVLASSPDILGEDGEFQPSDLDASDDYSIQASRDGNAEIVHPNGTIELNGVPFSEDLTFASIFDAVVDLTA